MGTPGVSGMSKCCNHYFKHTDNECQRKGMSNCKTLHYYLDFCGTILVHLIHVYTYYCSGSAMGPGRRNTLSESQVQRSLSLLGQQPQMSFSYNCKIKNVFLLYFQHQTKIVTGVKLKQKAINSPAAELCTRATEKHFPLMKHVSARSFHGCL